MRPLLAILDNESNSDFSLAVKRPRSSRSLSFLFFSRPFLPVRLFALRATTVAPGTLPAALFAAPESSIPPLPAFSLLAPLELLSLWLFSLFTNAEPDLTLAFEVTLLRAPPSLLPDALVSFWAGWLLSCCLYCLLEFELEPCLLAGWHH